MKVLLIGGGRMGQRHLSGLASIDASVVLVEPAEEARRACAAAFPGALVAVASPADVDGAARFDVAIFATTAYGRLECVEWALPRSSALLVEKPLEQSRTRVRRLTEVVDMSGVPAWANHYRRTLPGYEDLRRAGGPFVISVSSGAMGLGCNGIHWIDFALHLAGQSEGRLLFGEIEALPIGSGRGARFRDYGGRGLFAFPDGSRLLLSSCAASSAPTTITVVAPDRHWVIDQHSDTGIIHERPPGMYHPTYLYGKDYSTRQAAGLEAASLSDLTTAFVRALRDGAAPPQPRLAMVMPAYELLFDLLETSGQSAFDFT